ncbi:MAG: hypothetical protein BWY59_02396 [Verrucomicrobia bacterium ADurb.Bin345]|nr:MAG: hypothetical protein BWY59_02396 [Verrucomicrobia bacterium ADurb.Bin345]
MISLHRPSADAGLEHGVGHAVAESDAEGLHVVHEEFAAPQVQDLHLINGRRRLVAAVVQHAGMLDQRPRALRALIAVRPVRRQPVVGARVGELEAAAAAVRPLAPAPAVVIGHFVHHHKVLVRKARVVRLRQHDALAGFRQVALEVANRVPAVQHAGVIRHQVQRVLRDDEVAARGNRRARGEREGDSLDEPPVVERRRDGPLVVQFHVLVVVIAGDRVVHDLVDHHFPDAQRGVCGAGRPARQLVEVGGSVRVAPRGYGVLLGGKADRIHHPSVGRAEHDVLAGRTEIEGEIRRAGLVGHRKVHLPAAARDDGRIRNDELVRAHAVAEHATRDVDFLGGRVEQLDEVPQRIVRVREEFVDDDIGVSAGRERFRAAGRPVGRNAHAPRPWIILSVRGPAEHKRMARPVGRHRPWRLVAVVHLQQDRVVLSIPRLRPAQSYAARAVRKVPLEGAMHGADAVHGLHGGGLPGHYEIAERTNGCGLGKRVRNGSRQKVSRELICEGCRIEQFDILQILSVFAIRRVIHDLRNHDACTATGGARV